jgi:hypothetical protein
MLGPNGDCKDGNFNGENATTKHQILWFILIRMGFRGSTFWDNPKSDRLLLYITCRSGSFFMLLPMLPVKAQYHLSYCKVCRIWVSGGLTSAWAVLSGVSLPWLFYPHKSRWQCVKNSCPLVNIKIAGKWMFIPLKIVLIGIDS